MRETSHPIMRAGVIHTDVLSAGEALPQGMRKTPNHSGQLFTSGVSSSEASNNTNIMTYI